MNLMWVILSPIILIILAACFEFCVGTARYYDPNFKLNLLRIVLFLMLTPFIPFVFLYFLTRIILLKVIKVA